MDIDYCIYHEVETLKRRYLSEIHPFIERKVKIIALGTPRFTIGTNNEFNPVYDIETKNTLDCLDAMINSIRQHYENKINELRNRF